MLCMEFPPLNLLPEVLLNGHRRLEALLAMMLLLRQLLGSLLGFEFIALIATSLSEESMLFGPDTFLY